MMTKRILLLSIFMLLSNLAQAGLIYDYVPEKGSAYFSSSVSTMMIAYDAGTDVFTGLFEGDGFGVETDNVSPFPDYILSGSFTLNAIISEAGILSGGTVNWTGGGGDISAGTSLLTGNLVDFKYVLPPAETFDNLHDAPGPVFDFIIDVASSEELLNFSDLMHLRLYFSEGAIFGNPFLTSFDSDSPYTGQDLWSIKATNVPEPASLFLLGLGLAGIGFVRRTNS